MADSKVKQSGLQGGLLRGHWKDLLAVLRSKNICVHVANHLYAHEDLHIDELEQIVQDNDRAQILLMILERRSTRETVVRFAEALRTTRVRDVRKIGLKLLAGEHKNSLFTSTSTNW